MRGALGVMVLVLVLVGVFAFSARVRDRRHSGSRTVTLGINEVGVERQMADGRIEQAAWHAVSEVELVRTRVRTADGATEFALIAESLGDEPAGCLVPLGVGHDAELIGWLARLPGFDLARWSAAIDGPVPSRTVVWRRRGPAVNPPRSEREPGAAGTSDPG